MEKKYPFSVAKHGHDIELYHNRLFNTMYSMEAGEIPFDQEKYDRMSEIYYGDLRDLYEMMFNSRDGQVMYLTGKQIGLAKEIAAWAAETRTSSLIKGGKKKYISYV